MFVFIYTEYNRWMTNDNISGPKRKPTVRHLRPVFSPSTFAKYYLLLHYSPISHRMCQETSLLFKQYLFASLACLCRYIFSTRVAITWILVLWSTAKMFFQEAMVFSKIRHARTKKVRRSFDTVQGMKEYLEKTVCFEQISSRERLKSSKCVWQQ